MRTFLAIPIPAEIKQTIADIILPFKKQYPSLRWVAPTNYHLTLKFLGDISNNQLNQLDSALQCADYPASFSLSFQEFGAFPSLKSMHVLWLGVSLPVELLHLCDAVHLATLKTDIITDQKEKFKPHLTLARIKQDNIKNLKLLPIINIPDFEITEFNLYKSELTPKGPIYTIIKKYSLNTV